eukprot:CAMPEP_0184677720 /NCGR_PEP_ID=MMETSP0312-20130426/304_1 /TAXON_ID=31354 /ORGANISM="Compsopogon coeruleus, Strain SAG 36.94" /LENGTH=47 /DNA_ID= /DNA_START= /DNA_END= /DNA_ORIENTATION=
MDLSVLLHISRKEDGPTDDKLGKCSNQYGTQMVEVMGGKRKKVREWV